MIIKCITLWQPWASLIMIGAKPFEFRSWDYRERTNVRPGDRIGIHAAARPVKIREVEDLLYRLYDDRCTTGLVAGKAEVLIRKILGNYPRLDDGRRADVVERSAVLGTARIGIPLLAVEAMPAWKDLIGTSNRLEHCKWAWPMEDVQPFSEPIRRPGAQGWFNCNIPDAA